MPSPFWAKWREAPATLLLARHDVLGAREADKMAIGILDGFPIGGLELEHRQGTGGIFLGNAFFQAPVALADQSERQARDRGIMTDEKDALRVIAFLPQGIEQGVASIIGRCQTPCRKPTASIALKTPILLRCGSIYPRQPTSSPIAKNMLMPRPRNAIGINFPDTAMTGILSSASPLIQVTAYAPQSTDTGTAIANGQPPRPALCSRSDPQGSWRRRSFVGRIMTSTAMAGVSIVTSGVALPQIDGVAAIAPARNKAIT
jgi:hypothetical protein